MVEDLIKRLRDDAGFDGQKLLAANALEQQSARIAELTTCKLCNSTGNSTPCAYPTEINRQQAKRLTALESERDALLAAAGKEAVAGWKLVPVEPTEDMVIAANEVEYAEEGITRGQIRAAIAAAPIAALEKGDGRDAERGHWNPVYNTDPVQRACGELPEGWEIQILLERDAGCVYLIDPNGERSDIDNADKFDWTIHEAIDAALSQQKEVRDET
jgi:hypothetical protein